LHSPATSPALASRAPSTPPPGFLPIVAYAAEASGSLAGYGLADVLARSPYHAHEPETLVIHAASLTRAVLCRRQVSYESFVNEQLMSRLVRNGLVVLNISRAYSCAFDTACPEGVGRAGDPASDGGYTASDGVAPEVAPLLRALQATAAPFHGPEGATQASIRKECAGRGSSLQGRAADGEGWEEVGVGISVLSSRTGDSGAVLVNRYLGDWSAGWSEASRAVGWRGCIACKGYEQGSSLEVQALVGASVIRNFDYTT